jgi:exosortase H (IPTLxxWG-CTERM-specific)
MLAASARIVSAWRSACVKLGHKSAFLDLSMPRPNAQSDTGATNNATPITGAMQQPMTRFVLIFAILLVSLFVFYLLPWGERFMATPITSAVAKVSVTIMKLFDPTVASEGIAIFDSVTKQGITVVRGCNGMEAVIILFASVFAFPATMRQKFVGFIAGFFAIHALNIVRIVSLYYLARYSMTWFEWFHLYVWQMLIILDALVVWLLWLRWINKNKPKNNAPALSSVAQAG